jgi:DNA-binding CsgD family transcriptional regulator
MEALSPRLHETYWFLITGESERAIAAKMSISAHTVHDYVKTIYAHFGVSSRHKLIACRMEPLAKRQMTHRNKPGPPQQPTAKVIRLREAFEAFPPGLTYQQIAGRLGTSYQVARIWARKLGYANQVLPRGRPSKHEERSRWIRQLPPNLTIAEVSKRLKVSPATASSWIREAGYRFRRAPGSGQRHRKVDAGRWSKVDWSKTNIEIARRLGVSRERVRQVRVKYQASSAE